MNHQRSRLAVAAGALVIILAGVVSACSDAQGGAPTTAVTSSTPAAELRSTLNATLREHVSLAASATNAALHSRNEEFAAAAAALDGNSLDLAKIIGTAYGATAEEAFLSGWRRHIGFFVDYTNGVATKDEAKRAKAVADLQQYAADVAKLFHAANGLPEAQLVQIVSGHIGSLTAVIDAQAAGDDTRAYVLMREAADHMRHFSDPLAEATVQKFPEKFKG
jgi:hypothetical protein